MTDPPGETSFSGLLFPKRSKMPILLNSSDERLARACVLSMVPQNMLQFSQRGSAGSSGFVFDGTVLHYLLDECGRQRLIHRKLQCALRRAISLEFVFHLIDERSLHGKEAAVLL